MPKRIHVLTIGGETGPISREAAADTLRAFAVLYGPECEPKLMTVMPYGWERMKNWWTQDWEALDAKMRAGLAITFFGLELRLGPAYTISD